MWDLPAQPAGWRSSMAKTAFTNEKEGWDFYGEEKQKFERNWRKALTSGVKSTRSVKGDQELLMNLTGVDLIGQLCPEIETADIGSMDLEQLLTKQDCNFELQMERLNEFWPLDVRILMTLIFASLSAVGIIGNILVITVVFKVKGMITPTNCYLVSLAASDCLFFIATAPTELSYLHSDETEYIFGYFGCAFFTFLPYLAINSSSLSITAFTIERYIGICHPIRARYICTVKRAKTIISAIWLFCIIYNSPWLYLASLRIDNGEYSCSFKLERDHFTYKVMFLGDLVGFYVIPMLLYIAIYSKIAYALSRSQMKEKAKRNVSTGFYSSQFSNQHTSLPPRLSNSSQDVFAQLHSPSGVTHRTSEVRTSFAINYGKMPFKGKNQVVKMLALVVAIFAICWLPYRAMVMYNSFAQQKWDPDWYIFLSKTMIFFNCAINPILYNVMSARFRNAFRSLLKGKKKIIFQIQQRRSRNDYTSRFGDSLMDSKVLLNHAITDHHRTSLPMNHEREICDNFNQQKRYHDEHWP